MTPKSEIDRLVAGLENHPQVALLSDEIYSRMLYGGRRHISLLSYPEIRDRLILLNGWSKTYAMTGWRLGFAVWPDSMIGHATRLCINDHSCVNAATQMAGIAALEGPQDTVTRMVAEFDLRRAFLVEALNTLPGMRCADPGGAFYVFPNIEGTGLTSREAQNRFLNVAGVATVAGTAFGAGGEGHLRLSYATSMENIARAVERIADVLKQG